LIIKVLNHSLGIFTGMPFVFTIVRHTVIRLHKFRVICREIGMLFQVGCGIDRCVIAKHVLHFIIPVFRWIRIRHITKVPLAGKIRLIAMFFKKT